MRRRALLPLCALACWLPAPALGQTPGAPAEQDVVLGKPSSIQPPAAAGATVLVATGARLYRLPDRRSTLLDIVDAEAPRAVLDHATGWVLVRVQGQAGWVAVAGGRAGPDITAPPDLEYLATRSLPLGPETERLARARALLGAGAARDVGPFTFYTDLADDAVELLTRLAAQLPAAYEERYGVKPSSRDRFAVVIFTDEQRYREFERTDHDLAGLEASGHAAGNIAAFYAGGRPPVAIGPILLHELTHLLNQSVFRGGLPSWLEEGTAEDLSFSHIDGAGRLDPGRLGGVDRRRLEMEAGGVNTYVTALWGAPATLSRLVEAARRDQLLPLPDLFYLSRREMARLEGRPLRYGQSAFLVRYLIEGAGASGRDGLRLYLHRVAKGDGGEPDDLVRLVGRDWGQLTTGYERWLVLRRRALANRG